MTANPSSLTADLRRGDETQVLLKLQQDGVTDKDYAAIAKNDAMRAEIVAAILKHRLFTTPEEQIQTLLRINEAVWKDRLAPRMQSARSAIRRSSHRRTNAICTASFSCGRRATLSVRLRTTGRRSNTSTARKGRGSGTGSFLRPRACELEPVRSLDRRVSVGASRNSAASSRSKRSRTSASRLTLRSGWAWGRNCP